MIIFFKINQECKTLVPVHTYTQDPSTTLVLIDAGQPPTYRPMKATLLNILLTVVLIKVTSFSSTTMQQHTCEKDDGSTFDILHKHLVLFWFGVVRGI